LAAYAEVEVIGLRERQRLLAVIDTGYDGFLCLPVEIAVRLGLELAGSQWVQYADGRIERELVFRGRVAFLDEEREVDIHITEAPETLVGLALLQGYRLILDGDTHQVWFKRKKWRR
jgi:clan AA aspartic protease